MGNSVGRLQEILECMLSLSLLLLERKMLVGSRGGDGGGGFLPSEGHKKNCTFTKK